MANRFRGEIGVDVDGKHLVLKMDFNTMAEFEEVTGQKAMDFLEEAEKGRASIRDLRTFVHCTLLAKQPDATIELAGDVMSVDSEVLARLIAVSAPDAQEAQAAGNARKAPRARKKVLRA